jgi:5-(carboxyamino)imidazole ribonucleotide synthase
MDDTYPPALRVGVLGGGQLGRMLWQAAVNFNLDLHILDPDPEAPCSKLTPYFTSGSLTDYDTVYRWGQHVDLITIEIENVNVAALKALREEGKKVYPQPEIIELIQDKRTQKAFYQENDIPTADFILVEDREAVASQTDFLPAMHKLGREGYDGRGVQRLETSQDLEKAFDKPGLLEKIVPFEKEIAVIVARNSKGEISTYPAVEMVFHPQQNLVEYLFSPADINPLISMEAEALAKQIAEKLELVGILAIEMFVTPEGEILVNEMAPRPHNSGHHTIEGNITSQYEQHLRSILGLPLGDTSCKQSAAMINLLGAPGYMGEAVYAGMEEVLRIPGASVHLYGKKLTKPYRKMGHVTVVDADSERLKEKAKLIKETLKVIA